jgi:hypothetical protein
MADNAIPHLEDQRGPGQGAYWNRLARLRIAELANLGFVRRQRSLQT